MHKREQKVQEVQIRLEVSRSFFMIFDSEFSLRPSTLTGVLKVYQNILDSLLISIFSRQHHHFSLEKKISEHRYRVASFLEEKRDSE